MWINNFDCKGHIAATLAEAVGLGQHSRRRISLQLGDIQKPTSRNTPDRVRFTNSSELLHDSPRFVSELPSQAFIAVLSHFTARRGHCQSIYSDNAKNFVGARNELSKWHQFIASRIHQEEITIRQPVLQTKYRLSALYTARICPKSQSEEF
jgi:hypothetical protein